MKKELWELGHQLPADNKFQAVLKLALLKKSFDSAQLTSNQTNDQHRKMCRKCHISWSDGFFSVEVIPSCNRSRTQIEKLLSKGRPTKKRQSLIEHLKTRMGRVAKYTCLVCSYKTRIPLDWDAKWAAPPAVQTVPQEDTFKESYHRWQKEQWQKRKHGMNEKAGLKIPPQLSNKQLKKSGNWVGNATARTPASRNNHSTPANFKLVQYDLKCSLSGNANTKPKAKSKASKAVGKFGGILK
ncbi:uncharacterized protein LOC118513973 [Anopheles stephensi]|uniref:uncharacterized protein LOC118513973 n=1 Tax=Anopheles stephensi TaxID=30069 RepID=UPI0016587AF3|nr:uncharacterized protein LOC118513973 [Anopheles stephensi]